MTRFNRHAVVAALRPLTGAVLLGALVWLVRLALTRLIALEGVTEPALEWLYEELPALTGTTLAGIAALAALHLWRFGRLDERPQGPRDLVDWWSLPERIIHWLLVASFVLLLVTGVALYLAGGGLPSPLMRTMRQLHFGEAFMGLGAVLFVLWYRDALPRRYDLRWLARGGGYLGHAGPLPAGRFNAGQKIWFWLEVAGGLAMALSGYLLQYGVTRFDAGFPTLLVVHLTAGALFVCVLAVHFYLGVIGVRGALGGMIHGRIGRLGALRHHSEAEVLRRAT